MSQPHSRQAARVPPFSLEEASLENGDALVVVHGELDLFTAPDLREQLRVQIDRRPARLVVDLADCSFVDASGCHALLTASRRLAGHGGRLAIVNTNPAIARVFAVMGLDELFPVVPTRAEAVAALRQNAT
jgi:anti-sigma B factor antagonist